MPAAEEAASEEADWGPGGEVDEASGGEVEGAAPGEARGEGDEASTSTLYYVI